jgi:hydroxymethylpyrimidine pyrophosphatase-like HAD family hydrolase
MLAWAGRGVAMGQSPDELKLIADGVTLPLEDDGAAVELAEAIGFALED